MPKPILQRAQSVAYSQIASVTRMDQGIEPLTRPAGSIALEKKRWLVLLSFSLFTFSNASAFVTYAPILTAAGTYYGQTQEAIIWFSNIWYIVFVLLSFPALSLYNKSLSASLIASSIMTSAGAWVRFAAGDSFWVAMLGEFVITVAQLVVLPAPVAISERWFAQDERLLATSIAFFSNMGGLSFGYLSSALMVGDDPRLISHYLFVMAILLTVPVLLCALFMKNRPRSPPNFSSSAEHLNMIDSILEIFLKPRNLLDTIALSFYLGINWTFLSVLDYILEPFHYTPLDIGYLGLVMNIVGCAGGLVASLLIDRQLQQKKIPNYDFSLKLLSCITFCTILALSFILQFDPGISKWVLYVVAGVLGLGFNSFVPIAAQSMIETMFPINEVCGFQIFNMLANLFGFFGNLLSEGGIWMITGLVAPLFFYLFFFYSTKLKRLQMENKLELLQSHAQTESSVEDKNDGRNCSRHALKKQMKGGSIFQSLPNQFDKYSE